MLLLFLLFFFICCTVYTRFPPSQTSDGIGLIVGNNIDQVSGRPTAFNVAVEQWMILGICLKNDLTWPPSTSDFWFLSAVLVPYCLSLALLCPSLFRLSRNKDKDYSGFEPDVSSFRKFIFNVKWVSVTVSYTTSSCKKICSNYTSNNSNYGSSIITAKQYLEFGLRFVDGVRALNNFYFFSW